jgi:hypothetical protein
MTSVFASQRPFQDSVSLQPVQDIVLAMDVVYQIFYLWSGFGLIRAKVAVVITQTAKCNGMQWPAE